MGEGKIENHMPRIFKKAYMYMNKQSFLFLREDSKEGNMKCQDVLWISSFFEWEEYHLYCNSKPWSYI